MKFTISFLVSFLWFTGFAAIAQEFTYKGLVRDATTNEPLPFVSLQINNGPRGATADLDGRFQINTTEPVQKLVVSYLGYEAQQVNTAGQENSLIVIKLKPVSLNLQEVTIRAGYNPAHRIIKLATQSRKNNDPALIPSYTCRIYTKTVATLEPKKPDLTDTLTLAEAKPKKAKTDTTDQKEMNRFFKNNYLFLSETISDRSFMKPDLIKETVLANRVSGLQKPSFALLATESQAFSVYKEMSDFFGKSYLSPLSEGSTKKYDFRLENKTFSGSDTIFIISYQPLLGKNFEGLKGQLHISSDGWAVENIIAESNEAEDQKIKLQQHYAKVNGRWFPAEVNTDYTVGAVAINSRQPMAFSRSYYTNVNLNPEVRRRDFKAVTIKINPDAHMQTEEFWQQYRPDTLTARERGTYNFADSLGKEINLDRKMRIMEAIVSKQLPIGPVSLDLNRLVRFNRYEAVRLGAGAHTNELVSEFFTIGGYAADGFRDKGFKYGGDLVFNLYKPSGLKLTLNYFEDIAESGGTELPFYNPPLLGNNLRPLIIRNMDKVTHRSAALSFRSLKYLNLSAGLAQEHKRSTNGYAYEAASDIFRSSFKFMEVVIGARYAFREQVMQMFNKNISMGTSYPIFWLEYRKALDNLGEGEFIYHKLNARVEKTLKQKALGATKLTLDGGYVQGHAPYTNLYNGHGAFDKDYRVYTGEGFQTMGLNEFLLDKYAAVYLRHSFARLLYRSKNFSPVLAAVTNIGIGSLNHPEKHRNITFKTMEKGFFESGLLLNDLFVSGFSSFGLSGFYRYGAYRNPKQLDNIVLKLTASFTI